MINLDESVGVIENSWVVRYIRLFNFWFRQGFVYRKGLNFYLAYDAINFNFDNIENII
jgi:hypothetical protein